MLSPAVVQAVAAGVPQPSSGISTSWGGGGGGGGGDYDGEGGDAGGGYDEPGEADPTEEMPDELFAPREDDGTAELGGVDYHAALEDLGDWKSDLSSFGKTAAVNVGKQAITTIATKLTAAGKPIPPPVPPGIPMAAKVAIGGALALGLGYALTRHHSSAPTT